MDCSGSAAECKCLNVLECFHRLLKCIPAAAARVRPTGERTHSAPCGCSVQPARGQEGSGMRGQAFACCTGGPYPVGTPIKTLTRSLSSNYSLKIRNLLQVAFEKPLLSYTALRMMITSREMSFKLVVFVGVLNR